MSAFRTVAEPSTARSLNAFGLTTFPTSAVSALAHLKFPPACAACPESLKRSDDGAPARLRSHTSAGPRAPFESRRHGVESALSPVPYRRVRALGSSVHFVQFVCCGIPAGSRVPSEAISPKGGRCQETRTNRSRYAPPTGPSLDGKLLVRVISRRCQRIGPSAKQPLQANGSPSETTVSSCSKDATVVFATKQALATARVVGVSGRSLRPRVLAHQRCRHLPQIAGSGVMPPPHPNVVALSLAGDRGRWTSANQGCRSQPDGAFQLERHARPTLSVWIDTTSASGPTRHSQTSVPSQLTRTNTTSGSRNDAEPSCF